MQDRYLPRDFCSTIPSSRGRKGDHILRFSSLARGSESLEGRFVVNLSKQSKCWKKGTVKMESLPEFAMEMQKEDQSIYMDIHKGYRNFRLHPFMRDWSVFPYAGKYYQCVAMPFGCGRSPCG